LVQEINVENYLRDSSDVHRLRFFLHFSFQLTVSARSAYEVSGIGVRDPVLLRLINEVQHQVSHNAIALVRSAGGPSTDDILNCTPEALLEGLLDGLPDTARMCIQDALTKTARAMGRYDIKRGGDHL
jgi:hypothetical protein